ncbi:hypothetical protein QG041_08050, partial [Kingella kingae]
SLCFDLVEIIAKMSLAPRSDSRIRPTRLGVFYFIQRYSGNEKQPEIGFQAAFSIFQAAFCAV